MPRSHIPVATAAAVLLLALAPVGGVSSALASPAYSSGGCDINRSVDGPVAGGSQCAGADLSGEHLAQSDFDGADLTGADLSKADVQASTFLGAKISGADFTAARIVGADFTGAGIVPQTLAVTASTADGAPVTFEPVLPTGLTMNGCSIAGEPVASGATFPLGQTGVVCSFASSRPNEVATAVITITVSTAETTAPPVPVFTSGPTTTSAPTAASQGLSPQTLALLVTGAGGVLLLGVIALVIRGVLGRRGRAGGRH